MILKFFSWIGGKVMRIIDCFSEPVRKPDVEKDPEWEEAKERARRKPAE